MKKRSVLIPAILVIAVFFSGCGRMYEDLSQCDPSVVQEYIFLQEETDDLCIYAVDMAFNGCMVDEVVIYGDEIVARSPAAVEDNVMTMSTGGRVVEGLMVRMSGTVPTSPSAGDSFTDIDYGYWNMEFPDLKCGLNACGTGHYEISLTRPTMEDEYLHDGVTFKPTCAEIGTPRLRLEGHSPM